MYKTDSFISADEIKEIVGISKSKAYSLIQELNSELKEKCSNCKNQEARGNDRKAYNSTRRGSAG